MPNERRVVTGAELRAIQEATAFNESPLEFEYLLVHGLGSAIPSRGVGKRGLSDEEIYEFCLKNGVRWQDVLERIPGTSLS